MLSDDPLAVVPVAHSLPASGQPVDPAASASGPRSPEYSDVSHWKDVALFLSPFNAGQEHVPAESPQKDAEVWVQHPNVLPEPERMVSPAWVNQGGTGALGVMKVKDVPERRRLVCCVQMG